MKLKKKNRLNILSKCKNGVMLVGGIVDLMRYGKMPKWPNVPSALATCNMCIGLRDYCNLKMHDTYRIVLYDMYLLYLHIYMIYY